MELTAIIIFIGALIGIILWIIKIILFFGEPRNRVEMMMGAEVTVGIAPPLILFIIMAISAGIAWG